MDQATIDQAQEHVTAGMTHLTAAETGGLSAPSRQVEGMLAMGHFSAASAVLAVATAADALPAPE